MLSAGPISLFERPRARRLDTSVVAGRRGYRALVRSGWTWRRLFDALASS